MKGFISLFPLLSSWKVVVQDPLLSKKKNDRYWNAPLRQTFQYDP
ncbi:hypothetical protein [Candidatus Avelusimicrobium sp.]